MASFEPKIAIDGSAPYSNSANEEAPTASDYTNQPKNGKTWKLLKAKCAGYEDKCLNHTKEGLLFKGGFQMNTTSIAKLFCPQLKSEEDQTTYKERIESAAYVPTFSKLITGLISNLFSQDLAVMEAADHDDPKTTGDEVTNGPRDYYKSFEDNCDGYGTSLHNFIRKETTKALTHQCTYFGVDYPKGEAANRLEQEQFGLDKPRLYEIDFDSVYDYRMILGSPHEFEWIKLVSCEPYQPTPFDPPMHVYCVKVWQLDPEGYATYECYQTQPFAPGKEPKDKEVVAKTEEGTTSFKRIPIFKFHLEDGMAVGARLAPLASEHFARTTLENHATNKACITVPVTYRGDMFAQGPDSMPSPAAWGDKNHPKGKVNAKGIYELGDYRSDKFELVEAKGTALAFIHKQNEDLDEKMHSVVHQMGQSLKQSHSKSGKTAQSKQEDRRSTEMLLTAIADEVFVLVQRLFDVIAQSRGEEINFEVKGLSAIATEDRDELVLEVGLLPTLQIPSDTFKKEYYYRLASRLVEGTDQRTLDTIRMELEDGLEGMAPAMQTANGVPQPGQPQPSKPAAPAAASANSETPDPVTLGPAGQPLLPETAHLQTGQHVDGQVVYDQLAEDYQQKDIEFVKHIPWMGPVEVPLTSIDFSNKDNWQASQETDKVDQFADKMAHDNFNKPIILANNPSNDNKMSVIDGHHRALAALQNGQPVTAYVGQVGSNNGPWSKLHSKQAGSKQEASVQKEVSTQVSKSQNAKNGKTK